MSCRCSGISFTLGGYPPAMGFRNSLMEITWGWIHFLGIKKEGISGCWLRFQPPWKIWVNCDDDIPNWMEKYKSCSKPPTRDIQILDEAAILYHADMMGIDIRKHRDRIVSPMVGRFREGVLSRSWCGEVTICCSTYHLVILAMEAMTHRNRWFSQLETSIYKG